MVIGSLLQLLPRLPIACSKVDEAKFQKVFGPTSSLRRKIKNGQCFDLFINANSTYTDASVEAEYLVA